MQRELFLNALQQRAHFTLHHAFGGLIPLERTADEIVGAGVAHVLNDGRIDVAQIDETGGQFWRLRGGAAKQPAANIAARAIRLPAPLPAIANARDTIRTD